MNTALLRKWRQWIKRIRTEQLSGLLINQQIFRQFADCTAPYAGTYQAAELAGWMIDGYVVFAATTVRRMLEEPFKPAKPVLCPHCGKAVKKPKPEDSMSLVVLLRDIEQNESSFTRAWFRKRYTDKRLPVWHADQDFNTITRSKTASKLSASRVRRDIDTLHKVARPVRRLVNKAIAHTTRDRRKIGKPKFKQLNAAIEILAETYQRYSLLVVGNYLSPLVPPYDVSCDLEKVWPNPSPRQPRV